MSLNEQHLAYLTRVAKAEDELQAVYDVLLDDMKQAALLYKEYGGQFHERSMLRTLFVLVEGVVNYTGSLLLAVAETPGFLTVEETVLLRQAVPDLNDKGELESRSKHFDLKRMLQYVSRLHARLSAPGFAIDRQSDAWRAFATAVSLRHGITHPGPDKKLMLDESDHKAVVAALGFVRELCERLFLNKAQTLAEVVARRLAADNQREPT